jgi:hypothetical protein
LIPRSSVLLIFINLRIELRRGQPSCPRQDSA